MADACSERNRLRIVPLAHRRWALLHLDTLESRELAEAGAYELEYDDEDGSGCLIPDVGESVWAQDVLQWPLYIADVSGDYWVKFAWLDMEPEMITLSKAKLMYRVAQVRISIGQTSATLEHRAAIWTLPLTGSRVSWSLLDLWTALSLGKVLRKQNASSWLYRRWRSGGTRGCSCRQTSFASFPFGVLGCPDMLAL